jgi:hypothetical protein
VLPALELALDSGSLRLCFVRRFQWGSIRQGSAMPFFKYRGLLFRKLQF